MMVTMVVMSLREAYVVSIHGIQKVGHVIAMQDIDASIYAT
jgi:hypothetical protein